ncbi:MAG: S24/S26 family peptidase [Planctomycetota bacterium]
MSDAPKTGAEAMGVAPNARLAPGVTRKDVQIGDMAVELLRRGEVMHFRPKGHSMSPMIREYEEVLTKSVDPRDLNTGDIVVLYQPNGGIVIHRLTRTVRRRDGIEIWTKGDGGLRWDLPAKLSVCVGRAIAVRKPKQTLDLTSSYWRTAGYLAAQLSLFQTFVLRIPGFGADWDRDDRKGFQRFWLHVAKMPFRGFMHLCLLGDRIRLFFGRKCAPAEQT